MRCFCILPVPILHYLGGSRSFVSPSRHVIPQSLKFASPEWFKIVSAINTEAIENWRVGLEFRGEMERPLIFKIVIATLCRVLGDYLCLRLLKRRTRPTPPIREVCWFWKHHPLPLNETITTRPCLPRYLNTLSRYPQFPFLAISRSSSERF